LLATPGVVAAQADKLVLYTNEAFGLAFQYPASLALEERPAARMIIVAGRTDLEIVRSGGVPANLIFSVTLTTFRELGIESAAQLPAVIAAYAREGTPSPVRVGGADGFRLDGQDPANNLMNVTLMLSVGERRAAVVRGLSTLTTWQRDGQAHFEAILGTLNFVQTSINAGLPKIGVAAWALALDDVTTLVDLDLSSDGTLLHASDQTNGLLDISASGQFVGRARLPGIRSMGSVLLLRDGQRYIADPANGVIWVQRPESGQVRRFIGAKGNVFTPGSPHHIAFGRDGLLVALDDAPQGTRLLVFNRGGSLINTWFLATTINATLDTPILATDGSGRVYVAARNSGGVYRYFADGSLDQAGLGAAYLTETAPLALLVDRFDNLLVATEDKGILKFDPRGTLIGVIGQPYDQVAPPKLGQLGRPTALAISADGNLLYVADSGAHPQIASFAVDNNLEVNVIAGTRQAEKIIYGQTVSEAITPTTFVYEYPFSGRRNDLVTITAAAADPAALDMFVELVGPKTTRLAANDDAGAAGLAPTDAQIVEFRLPANGDYLIRVTRFGRETARATGRFTLTLAKVERR
jgi:sugar lactone lactonase YvrE